MDKILDNLFNKDEDSIQKIEDAIKETTIAETGESHDEKCAECNNEHCECVDRQSAIINFDLFIGELRQILNRYQGLDFELVQMKQEISNLIKDC